MRWILMLALSLASASAMSAESSPGAELRPSAPASGQPLSIWRHPDPLPARLQIPVELGDRPEGAVLDLLTEAGDTERYRVRVQFETSLALGDSGPHLDFDDWKHCQSAWHDATTRDNRTFSLPMPTPQEETCFPPVASAEIVDQARRALARYDWDEQATAHWLRIAREAEYAGGGQSYVAISTVRVRIEVRAPDGWRTLSILDFQMPMGC
jgi:hypothetical protein